MGMTIEDIILELEEAKDYPVSNEAIDYAIDTIHKYQKMQKVLERIWNIPSHLINKEECLDRIMETYREMRATDGNND